MNTRTKNSKMILASALISGLVYGASALADAAKTIQTTEKSHKHSKDKDCCKGKSCKAKDSCGGKEDCGGKNESKTETKTESKTTTDASSKE